MNTKAPLVVLAMVFASWAQSATYYVDCAASGDSGAGTSTTTAWKTINKVNKSHFNPGDSILFKRGCTWRETLESPSSGAAGTPITFGAYGAGAKPIISGSDLITGFVQQGSNVWDATVTTQPLGVWFSGNSGTKVASKAAVNSASKWYWATNVLSVYTVGDPSGTIEAGARDNGILVVGKSYVDLDGFEIERANEVLIFLNNSPQIVVSNCSIHDTPGHGLQTWLGNGANVIRSNEFYHTGLNNTIDGAGNGIQFLSVGGGLGGNTVEANYFHDLGGVPGDHHIYDETAGNITRYNLFVNSLGSAYYAIAADWVCSYNVFVTCTIGVQIGTGSTGGRLYNNTFYHCVTGGSPRAVIHYLGTGAGTSVTVMNNIISGGDGAFAVNNAIGYTGDYNLVYGTDWFAGWGGTWCESLAKWQAVSRQDAHSINADPRLRDPGNWDFALQGDSPCIDAGADLGPAYSTALMPGSSWPSNVLTGDQYSTGQWWEIGAYLFTGTGPPPGTPTPTPTPTPTRTPTPTPTPTRPPPATGTLFYPLTPCRVLDTRNATGPLGGPALAAGATRSFTVLTTPSTCGIPLNAKTLSVNLTVTVPAANGELRVFPGNLALPATSAISFRAGQTRANNAHLLLATDGTGSFKVQNNSTGMVHLIVDINGFYR